MECFLGWRSMTLCRSSAMQQRMRIQEIQGRFRVGLLWVFLFLLLFLFFTWLEPKIHTGKSGGIRLKDMWLQIAKMLGASRTKKEGGMTQGNVKRERKWISWGGKGHSGAGKPWHTTWSPGGWGLNRCCWIWDSRRWKLWEGNINEMLGTSFWLQGQAEWETGQKQQVPSPYWGLIKI